MTNLPAGVREHVLVLRCQAGDSDAFGELVSRYGPGIRYYLLKLLGSPEAAEDTSQEVWLDVYRGIARLRQPDSFRAWMYRIARDRASRAIRDSRSQSRWIGASDLAAEPTEPDFTAD